MNDIRFDIPLDHVITAFDEHLQAHPRTIFSAPFGEGKSYFLNQFKQNTEMQEKYLCLTVYPVNYQVAENADIFELIKRDILMQLIYNDVIPADYDIPDTLLMQFFILNYKMDIVSYILDGIASIPITNIKNIAQSIKSVITFKERISSKYSDFKKKFNKADSIIDFIDKTDRHFIYESDFITSIIKDCIEQYRNRTNKQVILVFEDMDRIDPAHLFRILNVLSAQVDYSYKYGVSPDVLNGANKFGVDNIVVVLDYWNAKHLFAHLYGEDVKFSAYISKFLYSTPFKFSISDIRKDYIYNYIYETTKIDKTLIELILPYDSLLCYKTIREISAAITDVNIAIREIPLYKQLMNNSIELNLAPLQLLIILQRLSDINTAKANIYTACQKHPDKIFPYLGGYILQKEQLIPRHSFYISANDTWQRTQQKGYFETKKYEKVLSIELVEISTDGLCRSQCWEYSNSSSLYKVDDLVDYMYTFILK